MSNSVVVHYTVAVVALVPSCWLEVAGFGSRSLLYATIASDSLVLARLSRCRLGDFHDRTWEARKGGVKGGTHGRAAIVRRWLPIAGAACLVAIVGWHEPFPTCS